ncbi:hypothetical protein DZ860_17330 [Vibrio sinensis]|uniref:Queuosine biosynthesis protein QueD n=1 Tax=Vibrio sinensis TaxID=2302434 RepID=A0A3A6QEM2_9VIBR|nr:VC2046/SO_2500 family protein [Vibrio sinensis]RJX68454.1 hypothetical protein DZ860_17330 [Vibrio sinensis]
MQIHTLNKAAIINELQFGVGINHAVQDGRRADFALILSMFSEDVRDNTPVEHIDRVEITEESLRQRFELPDPQELRSDQSAYAISAKQAELFHSSGLPSAKLSHYLKPEVLTYLPEDTHGFPEDVYHSLSAHQHRKLGETEPKKLMPVDLYNHLIQAQRSYQIHAQI